MSKQIRTLIVDDEPLARAHLRTLLEARNDTEVIGECGDGKSAVTRIRSESPELVLLDVQMPELDGFGVVREIGVDRMPAVVFVTAYDQHALSAFEVHALDYLLKPVHRARFNRAIDRVVSILRSESGALARSAPLTKALEEMASGRGTQERIAIKLEGRVFFVRVADIDWIDAADDHVRIHVGREIYEQRGTLSQLEQRLPASRFLRIHRSSIVNVERVKEFQPWFQGDWMIVLHDGTKLQSGRSYRARIKELLER